MIFLQEAMAAGPFLLISLVIIVILIFTALVLFFKAMYRSDKRKGLDKNDPVRKMEQRFDLNYNKETSKGKSYGLYFFAFVCIGAVLIFMNLVCNIKLD